MITDSRGIVTANNTPVHNGAIFRIVRARQVVGDDPGFTQRKHRPTRPGEARTECDGGESERVLGHWFGAPSGS